MPRARVGMNLLVLTDRPPAGTGHHAISLFEALAAHDAVKSGEVGLTGFAVEAGARHFSAQARERLVLLPSASKWDRVANELARLPVMARKVGIDWLINPAFFGAPWGSAQRVLIIHDLYFRSISDLVPWRRRILLRAIVPLLARRSDAIFTVSQTTKTEMTRFYPQLGARARVLHSGNRQLHHGDECLVPPAIGRPYLLMVGHLTANKRPETVIGALAVLRDSGRDLALVHIGDDGGRLGPLAQSAGIAAHVVALGPQPDSVLAAHYLHCAALMLPSIREGFGLPLIEAQTYGAPAIASSCEALMEVGGNSALYFPVDSVEDCAQAVRRVLDDAEMRAILRERGRANAARFSWDRTATQLLTELNLAGP